ncbi:MAG: hypothetical protein NTX28_10275 [Novosphingobium sp.]|nr:hypothetical protein [Novosphingobium sp.]
MTVAIETLAGDDATAFREAIKPHLLAVLDEENFKSAPFIDEQVAAGIAALDEKIEEVAGEADRATTQRILTETAALQAQAGALAVNVVPAVPAANPSAFFGQESADRLVATQAKLNLPANALALPRPGTDWVLGMTCRTGAQLGTGEEEILLSRGSRLAAGGSDRGVWLIERGVANTGLTFAWAVKQAGVQWMPNIAPVPGAAAKVEVASTYFFFMAQIADKPYVGYCQVQPGGRVVDGSVRLFTGDSNHGFGTFWFAAKASGTYTMARNANVITVTRSSGAHGLLVGGSVYLSADEAGVAGVYTVASVPNAQTFTVPSVGANVAAFTNPGYAVPNAVGNLFNCIGGAETSADIYGWAGGVADLFFRTGTPGVSGSLAALVLSGGALNPTLLANLANDRVAPAAMPGSDAYSHNLGDLTKPATGANSTTAPTAVGTIMRASPITQPEYLRLDARPHEWPHATALGRRTGSIRLTGTTNVAIRSLFATVYSDEAMTVVVKERHVCGYPAVAGGVLIETAEVPIGCGYWVKIESGDNPNVIAISGPHDVGPVYGVISQSTLQVLFEATTGANLAPVASNVGQASILHISGNVIDSPNNNYTNQAAFCRAAARRIRGTGQFGNGIVGVTNKLLSLFNAALGVKVPLGLVHLCTSGHSVDSYINDRKVLRNGIGNLAAGVASIGTWAPRAAPFYSNGTPVFTLAGTAKLYINGVLAATANGAGNWVGNGITGTFNYDTGAYSITASYPGVAEIEATMHFNTVAGSQTRKTLDSTLTVWGDEAQAGVTGRVLERLLAAKAWGGVTALVFSWENYRVSHLNNLSDADAALHTAFIMSTLRTRVAAVLGRDYPWLVMGDPRTASFSDNAEHRARRFTRAWAKSQANTWFIPAALTATMDVARSPHAGPNADGGQFIGEVMAHGIATVEGIAGAAGEEVMPIAAVRVSANTIDIYVSTPTAFPAATLVAGAGGAVQGVYFGATATTLLRIDPTAGADNAEVLSGYTISLPAANVVRIVKNSGNIGAGWWNLNWGAPFNRGTLTLTSLAAQAAAMDNSLFYNTGGFTAAARPGIGVQPAPDALYVA